MAGADEYLDLQGSFLEDLPVIKRYIYEGEEQFSEILDHEFECLVNSKTGSTELLLFHMSSETINLLFIQESEENLEITRYCSSFDSTEQLFLARIVTGPHGTAAHTTSDEIGFAINSMGLLRSLQHYGRATIKGERDTRGKQPDASWGPRQPPPGIPRSPTVVLEVAFSDTESKLQSDVRFWLNPKDGGARSCLTIQINRQTPEIRLERWELKNNKAYRAEATWVTKRSDKSDKVNVSGDVPFTIPFEHFFLRSPSTPTEKAVEIPRETLEDIADRIWDLQGWGMGFPPHA